MMKGMRTEEVRVFSWLVFVGLQAFGPTGWGLESISRHGVHWRLQQVTQRVHVPNN